MTDTKSESPKPKLALKHFKAIPLHSAPKKPSTALKTENSKIKNNAQKKQAPEKELNIDDKASVNNDATENAKPKKKYILHPKDYKSILAFLQERFPKCFPEDKTEPLPLKIGIHHDLFEIDDLPCSKIQLRKFLQIYTVYRSYKRNLTLGRDRIDLHGTPTSKVLEDEITSNIKTPKQPQSLKEAAIQE